MHRHHLWRAFAFVTLVAAVPGLAGFAGAATKSDETLLLQQPTVSAESVVFVYAQDLWIAGRDGGDARRLTSHVGSESSPRLSPDGKWVAFTGGYEGNADVYVISTAGGVPMRLTWHPGADVVRDWHPDGERILFTSSRDGGPAASRLFLVSRHGGMPQELAPPAAHHAAYSSDAGLIAYTPFADAFRSWKRYRGGRTPPVWIYDPRSHEVEQVPHVNASDTFPCWVGDYVYFASDRDNQMNLWRYKPGSGIPEQLTFFTDFDIRNMSAGAGVVIFEQAGALHIYDPGVRRETRLHIRVHADGLAARPHWEDVGGQVRAASIAPNGKRAVFEARGEIITVPRENGDPRNITKSPGANDRNPAWSPDGKQIAWFSDASGEYQLMIGDRLGREPAKSFDLGDGRFYQDPSWSPDGKRILFNDKTNRIAYITLESEDEAEVGKVTVVANPQGALGVLRPTAVWSPDSQWIAFEARNPVTVYDRIALYELASGKITYITDHFGMAGEPAFSGDGKYLFFTASVEMGPNLFGLNMISSASRPADGNLYVAVLKKDAKNPLAPKSDEAVEEEKAGDKDGAGKDGDEKKSDEKADSGKDREGEGHAEADEAEAQEQAEADEAKDDEAEETEEKEEAKQEKAPSIDIEGIDQRILSLPLGSGRFGGLSCTKDKLFFVEVPRDGRPALKSFDFESRKAATVTEGVMGFAISHDGKWILTAGGGGGPPGFHSGGGGGGWSIMDTHGGKKKSLAINSVKVRVDPAREWPQILRETWRIERDYFYDPNMHGVDWPAMWERWSAFLPYVKHRADLNMILAELIGELCCGHEYVFGGDLPERTRGVGEGLLGADFETADGRFRITRIYSGQNWNPGLRAPLTEPGVDVKVGDYLISVDGREVTAQDNLFAVFENTSGRQLSLTVSANADGSESRTSTVVPLRSDSSLRTLAWIERNRARVDALSGGRLAYIYMPNTAGAGMASFDRDFYSQLDRQGLIVDERFNGGGQVADYVIEVLSRHLYSFWMNREQWVSRSPFGLMTGPKVMVVNEYAGSGGDCMPWMFQKEGVGPIVGKRTWGGLVGISGYPPLMDGGMVTAASFGVMDTDGNWAVENEGVTPDYEVVQWPKEIIAGHDPQLEKAVDVALKLLEKQPRPKLPVYKPPHAR